ncbi:MAG TPA: HEAT repeat domain-containing protein [Gemmataceae bacterium]|nr:HEAT repeat domain-containing protein [Gemmataceae bacterium]
MAHEQLHELVKDVRRLLDAGTTAIADDRGLRQREQALQALGAKVPALAAVAEAIGRVRQAPPSRAAAPLCDLLLLTRQLAASLASAGCDGAAAGVEKSGPWQTAAALRDVFAWAGGSFTAHANDFKALQGAIRRPDFADLRLIEPLLKKLASPSGDDDEDLLSDQALPAFGAALVPDLRRDLNLQGGVAHARRLRTICTIDPRLGTTLCRQALADGGTAVKAESLRRLTRLAPADAERTALQVLGQKVPSRLAEAALRALATSQNDGALDALLRALLSNDFNLEFAASDVLATQPHPQATARLLELLARLQTSEVEARANARAKQSAAKGKRKAAKPAGPNDDDEVGEQIRRVVAVLGERKDAAAVPSLLTLLDHGNAELRESAIEALANLGDVSGLRAAADYMNDGKVWEAATRAAWLLPGRERYERLAAWVQELSQAKKSEYRRGKFVLELFEEEFSDPEEDFDDAEAALERKARRTDWDPRWLPLLRKHLGGPYRPEAALGLAAVLGEKAVPELLPLLLPSVKKDECGVVEALGYLRAREAVPLMVPLMPEQEWHHYCIHDALRRINDPTAIRLLEGLLEKTKDPGRRDCLAAVIEYLEKHRAKE